MSRVDKWIQDQDQDLLCPRCHSNGNIFIALQCSHTLCLLCTAYTYIKFKSQLNSQEQIKCIQCMNISSLSDYQLQLIHETIKDKVIPMIGLENNLSNQNKFPKSKRNSSQASNEPFYQTVDKKMRSQEHSFENITPSTKYFFSKCESPTNKKYTISCCLHPNENLSFLCFTCNNLMLCSSCIKSKTHTNHEVKTLKKGVDSIIQQITLGKLETTEKIECIEMWQRRLNHGKKFLTDRRQKTVKEIQNCFIELAKKLKSKQQQLFQNCKQHFQTLFSQMDLQSNKLSQYLENYKNYNKKLAELTNVPSHVIFINQFNKLKTQISKSYIGALEPKLLEMLSFQSTSMHKDINQISECIEKIKISYNPYQINQHSKDQDIKLKSRINKDQNYKKIMRTNFGSVNSSSDKRDRKCAKTEEDQTRKIPHKKGKQLPAYITQFFDKHNIKPYHNGMSCLLDLQPFLNYSKTSNLISKSVLPEDKGSKKNTSIPKDRLQRKTTNPHTGKSFKLENFSKNKLC